MGVDRGHKSQPENEDGDPEEVVGEADHDGGGGWTKRLVKEYVQMSVEKRNGDKRLNESDALVVGGWRPKGEKKRLCDAPLDGLPPGIQLTEKIRSR